MKLVCLIWLSGQFIIQAPYGIAAVPTGLGEDAQLLLNQKEGANTSQTVSPPLHSRQRRAGRVVFYDDFSSGHIDSSKWKHDVSADGVGHNEFQMYTPEAKNSYVKNGVLFLRPTLTADTFGEDFLMNGQFDSNKVYGKCTNGWCVTEGLNHANAYMNIHPIMSSYLTTTTNIRYGRVEVLAQLPKGDWLWPAIWMMPRTAKYGAWPRSGEIDLMEAAGNRNLHEWNGSSIAVDVARTNLHYGPDYPRDLHNDHNIQCQGCTYGDGYHTYWLDWTADHIALGVDSHTVQEDRTPPQGYWHKGGWSGRNIWASGGLNAPFDQPFYLILNVAVGGDFFWDGVTNKPYPKPWSMKEPTRDQMIKFWNTKHLWYPTWHGEEVALKIKYVKMWQY